MHTGGVSDTEIIFWCKNGNNRMHMEGMKNMIEIYVEKTCSLFLVINNDLCVTVFKL